MPRVARGVQRVVVRPSAEADKTASSFEEWRERDSSKLVAQLSQLQCVVGGRRYANVPMIRSLALLALLAFASACANTGGSTGEPRFRQGQTIVSRVDPAIRVSVDRELPFLGEIEAVVMNGDATMHQYWFADIEDGQLKRAVIVHFERMNEGSDRTFGYPTFRMETLGAQSYLHQSFPEPVCELITDEVRAFLAARGAVARQGCVSTRYVRAVREDKLAEMIFFYVEPTDNVSETPEGLGEGFVPTGADTPWGREDARLTRALRSLIHVEG